MAGKLKPLDIPREEKPGKYADGDGLYLIVTSPTSKNWSYRYWYKGKQRWYGLGSFKDVSLKEARLARDAARLRVRTGVDLVQEKRAAREEQKAAVRAEKARNSVAVFPQAIRLSDDWPAQNFRDKTQPYL